MTKQTFLAATSFLCAFVFWANLGDLHPLDLHCSRLSPTFRDNVLRDGCTNEILIKQWPSLAIFAAQTILILDRYVLNCLVCFRATGKSPAHKFAGRDGPNRYDLWLSTSCISEFYQAFSSGNSACFKPRSQYFRFALRRVWPKIQGPTLEFIPNLKKINA